VQGKVRVGGPLDDEDAEDVGKYRGRREEGIGREGGGNKILKKEEELKRWHRRTVPIASCTQP